MRSIRYKRSAVGFEGAELLVRSLRVRALPKPPGSPGHPGRDFDLRGLTGYSPGAGPLPLRPGLPAGGGERLPWPFEDPASATGGEEEILGKFCEVGDQIG